VIYQFLSEMGALCSREYKLLEIVWYVNSLSLFPHTLEPYLFPHTSLVPRPRPAFCSLQYRNGAGLGMRLPP